MKDFLASTPLVTNFIAIFLVVALVSLVVYAVVSNQGTLAVIVGFSSGIIGTIAGYYFNKEQLNAVQRDEQAQAGRAEGYSVRLSTLQVAYDRLLEEHEQLLNESEQFLDLEDGQ